jgi:hypothetical protein
VHIEALLVVALGPWHDVRGPQKRGLRDAGERTAPTPIIHEGAAKQILTDALYDEAFGLGCSRQLGGLSAKAQERRVRQTHSEFVNAVERGMELGQRLVDESGCAGTWSG